MLLELLYMTNVNFQKQTILLTSHYMMLASNGNKHMSIVVLKKSLQPNPFQSPIRHIYRLSEPYPILLEVFFVCFVVTHHILDRDDDRHDHLLHLISPSFWTQTVLPAKLLVLIF